MKDKKLSLALYIVMQILCYIITYVLSILIFVTFNLSSPFDCMPITIIICVGVVLIIKPLQIILD
jgi:hypothetical protein